MSRKLALGDWVFFGMALAAAVLVAGSAAANARYEYEGVSFRQIQDEEPPSGSYTTEMRVTGHFELARALPASMPFTNVTADVLSISLSDGRETLSNPDHLMVRVATNAAGDIYRWSVSVSHAAVTSEDLVRLMRVTTANNVVPFPGGVRDIGDLGSVELDGGIDMGGIARRVGAWSLVHVPEPTTALLVGLGVVGLAASRRRSHAR